MVLMGGDFNTVQNGKLDRLPPEQGLTSRKSRVLNDFIRELGLIDPWRNNNPREKDFTFYSNPHGCYSRIDFFCVSQQHIHKVVECGIETVTISDHAPMTLIVTIDKESFFK